VEPDGDLRPGFAVPAFGLNDDDLGSIKLFTFQMFVCEGGERCIAVRIRRCGGAPFACATR
jgi:hypothetical protein